MECQLLRALLLILLVLLHRNSLLLVLGVYRRVISVHDLSPTFGLEQPRQQLLPRPTATAPAAARPRSTAGASRATGWSGRAPSTS
jgi:hypothetical protein